MLIMLPMRWPMPLSAVAPVGRHGVPCASDEGGLPPAGGVRRLAPQPRRPAVAGDVGKRGGEDAAGREPPAPPGGGVHTYPGHDPKNFPSPTEPPPDLAGAAFEHMLEYGSMREFTDEELARAVRLDPSMFPRLGPSLESLAAMLRERKAKILATYETDAAAKQARRQVRETAGAIVPRLPIRRFVMGPYQGPGTGLIVAEMPFPVAMMLKSGKLGGPDIFLTVLEQMRRPQNAKPCIDQWPPRREPDDRS